MEKRVIHRGLLPLRSPLPLSLSRLLPSQRAPPHRLLPSQSNAARFFPSRNMMSMMMVVVVVVSVMMGKMRGDPKNGG